MNESPYTIGAIVTMLLAALGAFMKGTIMLTSTHTARVADYERRIDEERKIADEERRRADRFAEFGMRATGVTEELIAITKTRRDELAFRESQERERPR